MDSRTFSYTIFEVLDNKKELSEFVKLIKTINLDFFLKTKSPITVIAPTNIAVDSCKYVNDNPEKEEIKQILLNHIIPGEFPLNDLLEFKKVITLSKEELDIYYSVSDGDGVNVFINSSLVIEENIKCLNGYIHIIDKNCLCD